MAPFVGPTREQVLALLRGKKPKKALPISLGTNVPKAQITCEEGLWALRPLVINHEKARAAGEAALARGDAWMPEMEWQFIEPGAPIASAASASELADAIEELPWTY